MLLAVPYCHIIVLGGIASLRLPLSITFSKHSAWHSAATWVPPYYRWWRFMSSKRIDSTFLVLSKFIADIIFSVCSTPATLRLYTLMICTSPLYVWIVITVISGLTGCHNYKAGPIFLLTIKHIHVAAFGSYRSWNPQGQYVDFI